MVRPAHLGTKAIIALAAALVAVGMQATAQEATSETPGALPPETPTSPISKNGDAINRAEPTGSTDSGMILVSKRPIEVLAGPSSSASMLYGFPAGRPFRLIGRNGDFAQIQDLKSGATGWIDETALAQSPPMPVAAVSDSRATSPNQNGTALAQSNAKTQNPESHGIFGLGSNKGQGIFSGFLGGVFGTR